MSGHLELDPAQNTESGLVLTQRHFSMGLNPKPYTSVHFDSPQDASGHPYFLPFLRSMLIGVDFYLTFVCGVWSEFLIELKIKGV